MINGFNYSDNKKQGPSGYVPRDYTKDPVGFSIPEFTGKVYPRSEWDELIDLQEKNQSSPWHWHVQNCEIKSQARTNFCWCFGTVSGVETRYAMTGINPPNLSPTSTACLIKDFKNQGGWGTEACRGIQKYGIAEHRHWPTNSFDRTLPVRHDVRSNMHMHDLIDFEDLGYNRFDAVMSALLDPHDPSPVTGGFMYSFSGPHLVLLLRAVKVGGEYGVVFANSWGKGWGVEGYGVLVGKDAIPQEAVRIGSVKPRS